jgi:hypothetical protein
MDPWLLATSNSTHRTGTGNTATAVKQGSKEDQSGRRAEPLKAGRRAEPLKAEEQSERKLKEVLFGAQTIQLAYPRWFAARTM